jgi:hypothetical protein
MDALVTVKRLFGDVFCDPECSYLDVENGFCDLVHEEIATGNPELHSAACVPETRAAEALAERADGAERRHMTLTADLKAALEVNGYQAADAAKEAMAVGDEGRCGSDCETGG